MGVNVKTDLEEVLGNKITCTWQYWRAVQTFTKDTVSQSIVNHCDEASWLSVVPGVYVFGGHRLLPASILERKNFQLNFLASLQANTP